MSHERSLESRAEGPLSLARGFELVKEHGGTMFPPDSLSDEESEKYREAMDAMNRAWKLREVMGGNVSSNAVADKYLELVEELQADEGVDRSKIEEQIVVIAGSFGISGLGNVLQSAEDGRMEHVDAYVEQIRGAKLKDAIRQGLEFLDSMRPPGE